MIFLQLGNQHSQYKAILPSIILTQQCYEGYFISYSSEAAMRLDYQILQKLPP